MSRERPPAIRIDAISKSFGATRALDRVSFSIAKGSVHALLGENGAGKSTTMKILSGLVEPDSGGVHIDGSAVRLRSPRDAHRHGIQTAFQELTLVPDLTVLENMMIPRAPVGLTGMIRSSATARQVEGHFRQLGLDIDIHALAGDLELAQRQKIEIARALSRKPQILLLDEPTSALAGSDVAWLGRIIAGAKAADTTVLFISHRLPEVRAFCDRLTILRNGQVVTTADVHAVSDDEVVEQIIGRSLDQAFPPRSQGAANERPIVLETRRLSAGHKLRDVDLDLRAGEIHGIAGLQGMGQHALFSACFGAMPLKSGELRVDGRHVHLASPADALHPTVRIGLVPEERKTEGLFLKLDGTVNVSLPAIDDFSRFGLIDLAAERSAALKAFSALDVADRAIYTAVGAFSGGNQQKIAIAKWILAESRILLLFDPTRGIDVGTKHQLYVMMRNFADAGGAVLFHSTEIPELVHLCDRVSVLYEGCIVARFGEDDIDERAIMEAALGGRSPLGAFMHGSAAHHA